MGFDFGEIFAMTGEEAVAFNRIMIVYLVIMLLSSIYSLVVYVLHSLGMYTISKRRGIHHPWLAWIPLGNMWILGSIGDQYRYVAKGKITSRRKTLLGLSIAFYAVMVLFLVAVFVFVFGIVEAEMSGYSAGAEMIAPSMLFIISYLVMWVLAIVLAVFQYIAYYDLFASCTSNNAVLFLVLSIFFSFLLPFFVFAVRKKDEGMPPRRPQIPTAPWQPAPPPPAPTWQQAAAPQAAWQPPAARPTVVEPVVEAAPVVEPPAEPVAEEVPAEPVAEEPETTEE